MFRIVAALASATLLAISPAQAAWVYQANEDAFSDEVTHLALGLTTPYGVGFRCTASDDLALIYMTPEESDGGTLETLAMLEPAMLVRVDDQDVVSVPVTLELAQDKTIMAFAADSSIVDVAKATGGAKRRLAIALEIMDQRMHVKDMDVTGSTRAIDQLLEGCGIE